MEGFLETHDAKGLKAYLASGEGDPNAIIDDIPEWYAPALYWAYGDLACMRVLLEAGADPNALTVEGNENDAVLVRAVRTRDWPVLRLLVECGVLRRTDPLIMSIAMYAADKDVNHDMLIYLMRAGASCEPGSSDLVQRMETARWACRITCQALSRVLRTRRLIHKDIIPLVVRHTWALRFRSDWVDQAPRWWADLHDLPPQKKETK